MDVSSRFLIRFAGLRWLLGAAAALAIYAQPLIFPFAAYSDAEFPDIRGRFSEASAAEGKIRISPVSLAGGSSLTLISPEEWTPIAARLSIALEETHLRFTALLGALPSFASSLRLLPTQTFHLLTGAPEWTNALYFRGQIMIPLHTTTRVDYDNLTRSIRHEYTHAILNALSGGKCPGWLDEGLAQWAEGTENPALRPALAQYLLRNPPVPLKLLQGGFTRLDTDMVAAAYAQSLIAAIAIVDTFGFPKIRAYMDGLKAGQSKSNAFLEAFSIAEDSFERSLHSRLRAWAASFDKRQLVALQQGSM